MRRCPPYLRPARFSRLTRAAVFTLAVLLLSAPAARAGWVLQGNAYTSGSNIVITQATGNQVGAAWLDSPIDLDYDFDISLQVYLGSNAGGADGLSIVFQNDPRGTAAVGDTLAGGEWIGMHNIYPAVSVELDTYQNTDMGDPNADHIAVNEFPASGTGVPNHAGAGPVSLGNIEDGAYHTLRLVWNAAAYTLTIYFDGTPRITYTNDFAANILGASQAWFGVVGSTGGAFNLQQFIPLITNTGMSVTKSVTPSAVNAGAPVTYTVTVANDGAIPATLSAVADQLPAGFAYRPGTSTGLTTADPTVSGQTLTWSGNWTMAPGQTRTLSFQANSASAPGAYTNTVTISGSDFADLSTGPTAPVTVWASDLSTSTKTVLDTNGGDAMPGDILQYTITLNESAGHAAGGVSVTDDIPADVTGFTVVSLPAGAVDDSTGAGTGANGTGRLNVTNIAVPANGSAAIVFDVTIAAGTAAGTTIDNTATVTNPTGTGAAPAAPTVVVAASSIPASGNKPLYLHDNLDLSRTPPTGGENEVRIRNGSATWTLTPALATALTINGDARSIPVLLYLRRSKPTSNGDITVTLISNHGTIGSASVPWGSLSSANNPALVTFNIPVSADISLAQGDTLGLTITNPINHNIHVYPTYNGGQSQVALVSRTVINVDWVRFYNAAYPGGTQITTAVPGQTVYIRAQVSDPFGSFDITSAALQEIDPGGATVINGAAMTQVYDSGAAIKTYEYTATIPTGGLLGYWTARVTAQEGTEGLVQDTGVATLQVAVPDIVLVKLVSVFSDPINGSANPKAIPGALMQYTITATNQGGGPADGDSVTVVDPVPAHTSLFVGDLGAPGSGPVAFSDGNPPSGLSYTFGGLGDGSDDLDFSNDGGATWTYTPTPDGNGVDAAVTNVRIHPTGSFNGASGGSAPSFTLRLRVRVK